MAIISYSIYANRMPLHEELIFDDMMKDDDYVTNKRSLTDDLFIYVSAPSSRCFALSSHLSGSLLVYVLLRGVIDEQIF